MENVRIKMNILKQTLAYLVLILITGISIKYEIMAYSSLLIKLESGVLAGMWAVIVAITLNIGKFLMIQSIIDGGKSLNNNWQAYLIVILLMINSFVWSFSVIGVSLDSPQLEKVSLEKQAHLKKGFEIDKGNIISKFDQLLSNQRSQTQVKTVNLEQQHQTNISLYEQQLENERENKNKFSGFYRGDKYKDISDRLEQAKADKNAAYQLLQERQDTKTDDLNQQKSEELQILTQAFSEAYKSLDLSELKQSDDERIQDPMITSSKRIFNDITNSHLSYIQFIAYISLLMAMIIELLSFNLIEYIDRLQKLRTQKNIPEKSKVIPITSATMTAA